MTKQVGKKGFKINLTVSLQAGIKTLEELFLQGHIPTTVWSILKAEPIGNNGAYSDANRILIFTFENGLMVEVKVTTWKIKVGDIVSVDKGREWYSYIVYIKGKDRMKCFTNHVGNKPWCRQHEDDKPFPGVKWRNPTHEEIAIYKFAIENHREKDFIEVYYSDLIDWTKLNEKLGMSTAWFKKTLQENRPI